MGLDKTSGSRGDTASSSKPGAKAKPSASAAHLSGTTLEQRIRVGPARLFVRDEGQGDALLLAHGMWCAGHMFDPMVAELSTTHRVITPDLRAHGKSGVPRSSWSVADVAGDYLRVLDALRVDRVILGGYSMGGMAAVHFALRYPDRLSALILMSTSGSAEPWVRRREIDALAATVALVGAPHWLALQAAYGVFTPDFRRSAPEVVERWTNQVEAMTRAALIQALRAVSTRPSLEHRLSEITTPTLILAGQRDWHLSSQHSVVLSERIPGSQLAILPGVGHGLPIERPGETVKLIRAFLRKAVS
jgi:pimeloyl-ACP methyl ester carboxylesterase